MDNVPLPHDLIHLVWNYLPSTNQHYLRDNDLGVVIRYKKHFDLAFVTSICDKYGINIHASHTLKPYYHSKPFPFLSSTKYYVRYVVKYKLYRHWQYDLSIPDPAWINTLSRHSGLEFAVQYNNLYLISLLPYQTVCLRYATCEALNILYERCLNKDQFLLQVLNASKHFQWVKKHFSMDHSTPYPPQSLEAIRCNASRNTIATPIMSQFAQFNSFEDVVTCHQLFPDVSLDDVCQVAAWNNDYQLFQYALPHDQKVDLELCLTGATSHRLRYTICNLLNQKFDIRTEDVVYHDNLFWMKSCKMVAVRDIFLSASTGIQKRLIDNGYGYRMRRFKKLPLRRSIRIAKRQKKL